ncbi:hypothetical protein Micbo1qcDRAFT_170422 [Microdochium bolleyi]|uniref:Uncharacterized protein n=1 Tax=Microdochium bolleyi TaxID=196109 RepID=A0A136JHJ2_9PEZI|nr:hypothetical protein Micbo1qcDRAFT_170422 [Microdochium bolleyi]
MGCMWPHNGLRGKSGAQPRSWTWCQLLGILPVGLQPADGARDLADVGSLWEWIETGVHSPSMTCAQVVDKSRRNCPPAVCAVPYIELLLSDHDDINHTTSPTADRTRLQSDVAARPNESAVGPDRNLLPLACPHLTGAPCILCDLLQMVAARHSAHPRNLFNAAGVAATDDPARQRWQQSQSAT